MGKRITAPTAEEMAALKERAEDLSVELHHVTERIKHTLGGCPEPLAMSRQLSRLASNAAELAMTVLQRPALDEDRARIEAKLKQRAG